MELIKHWKVSFFRWNFNEKYSEVSEVFTREPTLDEIMSFAKDCDNKDSVNCGFGTTIEVSEYYQIITEYNQ